MEKAGELRMMESEVFKTLLEKHEEDHEQNITDQHTFYHEKNTKYGKNYKN